MSGNGVVSQILGDFRDDVLVHRRAHPGAQVT